MSFHDEFNELETRLRQSKPKAEPLPPALKRQMRQTLMEQMTMNDNRFSFRKLSVALGGLILLIGIPVFFWLAQMSIGAANVPGAASDPSQLDPSRPTPTVAVDIEEGAVEVPFVELAEDQVWVISADIAQGETVGRYGTINVTVGYELVNVSEAELIVKLVDGPRGVLTVEKMVSGASGTAVIPLQLAALEEVAGESIGLELNLILRDPSPGGERLLYLDFVEGWTIDLTAEPETTTAEIIQISKPVSVESEGLSANTTYEIELTTAYTLQGYEEALLVVGYEFTDENGSAGGYEVNAISAGSGTIPVTMWLDGSFFDARGETIEGVRFFVRINRYDEGAAQWVNLFPGNEPLLDGELALPYPYLQDSFFVQSAAWAEDEAGQMMLNVTMGYKLTSQPMADIVVNVTGAGEGILASDSATVEAGDGSVTIPIPFDQALLADNPIVQITAVFTAGEVVIQDEQSAVYQSQTETAEPAAGSGGHVWIISTNVVTRTTENGVAADITLVVGYELSSDYSGGRIAFSNEYQASVHGGGSGGGGGSAAAVTSGSGTTEFVFGFETTSWAIARDWLATMSSYLKLFGYSAAGDELLLGEYYKIGTD